MCGSVFSFTCGARRCWVPGPLVARLAHGLLVLVVVLVLVQQQQHNQQPPARQADPLGARPGAAKACCWQACWHA
jgi:hypothetical protein